MHEGDEPITTLKNIAPVFDEVGDPILKEEFLEIVMDKDHVPLVMQQMFISLVLVR